MEPNYLSSAIVVFILAVTSGHLSALSFIRLPQNDVMFTENVLLEVSARSRIECSIKCGETEGCVMCTFLSSPQGPAGLCRLHSQVQTTAKSWYQATGAKSLERRFCEEGYEVSCGRCLRVITDSGSHQKGQKSCSLQKEGRLAVLKTENELQCVADFLGDIGLDLAWVGADDLEKGGHYQWNDGAPLLDDSFLWDKSRGEPDSDNIGQACVAVKTSSQKLRNGVCSQGVPALCQKDFL